MNRNGHVPDRSRDLSQPLEKLGPDETLKARSDQLRGTIAVGLRDEITAAVPGGDPKLMKFHGLYQQDDRDLRDERRRQKLEPAYAFMVRLRLPGGVCTPPQWLKLDGLARAYAGSTLRLTTRQTFQLHRVRKHDLRPVIQGLREVRLDTRSACGDDARGVMCSVNPELSALHASVYDLARRASDHAIPQTGAYREIWYGEERTEMSGPEEPFYGRTYLPRKFKIGFVIPPINDIDVYAQDLGFIAIATDGGLDGCNVVIGGSMGRTDQAPRTYPRLADLIGFVPGERVLPVIDAVMSVQRDYGDRVDRAHARFKYTIHDHGLDWIKAEIERRLGFAFDPPREYRFTSNGDALGWTSGEDGREHYTLFIENGRIRNDGERLLMDGLRAIARVHRGAFRLTPNQNLIVADIAPGDRPMIERLLREYRLSSASTGSALRLNSMACVSLPTCGLAMAESERYLPGLLRRIEVILSRHGLDQEPITLRMSGCPNGCSRPYIAEIGLTGRAPGKYNLYFGGGFHGQRLNRLYLENTGEGPSSKPWRMRSGALRANGGPASISATSRSGPAMSPPSGKAERSTTDAMNESSLRRTPMSLQLGQTAPDFEQRSTHGLIRFHAWLGQSWGVLFSHPKDFTPVCTTELGEVARLKPEWDRRGVKPLGLSVDPIESHQGWEQDIAETQGQRVNFPMLADPDQKVAALYGMIHPDADPTVTVRAVYVIDPLKKIRLILTYPPSAGRNFAEILRAIDSLQLTDGEKVSTPVNWEPGQPVVISPKMTDEEAKARFPQGWKELKPYLRLVQLSR